jgi:hypothetical protein
MFQYYEDFFTELFGTAPQTVKRGEDGKEFYFYYPVLLAQIRELTHDNTMPPYPVLEGLKDRRRYLNGFFTRAGHVGFHRRLIKSTSENRDYPYFGIKKRNAVILPEIKKMLGEFRIQCISFPGTLVVQHLASMKNLLCARLLPSSKTRKLEEIIAKGDSSARIRTGVSASRGPNH